MQTLPAVIFLTTLTLGAVAAAGAAAAGRFSERQEPLPDAGRAEILCTARDRATGKPLAVRVVVTAADGSHPDGSGRGVYGDGRFFAEGTFTVTVPPGTAEVALRAGPDYAPLTARVTATAGKRTRIDAELHRWFAPEAAGWHGGESHVHTSHDRAGGGVRTDHAYTATQARAQGLRFLSQASKGSADQDPAPLSTPDFLFRNAAELGFGPFVGHLTTPGIRQQVDGAAYAAAYGSALPVQSVLGPVHALGGVVVYTHPLAPPYQNHWMGATESWSDGVLGRCADLFDVDGRGTELLWFSLLNLGNRVAVSSYTDSALERTNTLSPGDRRVYVHAKEFTFPSLIAAMREGRTFATNGGPVFPFFTLEGREPGETLPPVRAGQTLAARATVRSLYPLRSAELYHNGRTVHSFPSFPVRDRSGETVLRHAVPAGDGWYVFRVEDEKGNWAITSPVYVAGEAGGGAARPRAGAHALLLEISNHTRWVQLRRDFFAHLIVTVAPGDPLREVTLLRDGQPLRRWTPGEGSSLADGQMPVTGGKGEYGPGWHWHGEAGRPTHFLADWPVTASGAYELRAVTASGKALGSDAVRHDAAHARSRQASVAHLRGPALSLTRWGYGEEMPLGEITLPFEGDHWWYPARTFWRMTADFGGETRTAGGGDESHRAVFEAR